MKAPVRGEIKVLCAASSYLLLNFCPPNCCKLSSCLIAILSESLISTSVFKIYQLGKYVIWSSRDTLCLIRQGLCSFSIKCPANLLLNSVSLLFMVFINICWNHILIKHSKKTLGLNDFLSEVTNSLWLDFCIQKFFLKLCWHEVNLN